MKALVVGATGFMGRETARQLLASGWEVRVLARAPEKAADLHSLGAEVMAGDLVDPHSLAGACQKVHAVVDAVHSLLGSGKYSSEAVDWHGKRELIRAAKQAGAAYFVFTSMQGASPGSPVDFMRYKAIIEKDVEGSGMDYTILRPPSFMEWHAHIFLGKDILEKGKATILGSGKTLFNFMSAADVARFAVIALQDSRACDRVLEIGGPDNLSKNELAQLYMRLSGRQANISHLPPVMLRILSVVLKPVNPPASRIMLLSFVMDRQSQAFDARNVLAEFGVNPLSIEEFVQARVAEWKAAA